MILICLLSMCDVPQGGEGIKVLTEGDYHAFKGCGTYGEGTGWRGLQDEPSVKGKVVDFPDGRPF